MSMKAIEPKRKHTIILNERDIEITLNALGLHSLTCLQRQESPKHVDIVIDKIYRALGIRLDK